MVLAADSLEKPVLERWFFSGMAVLLASTAIVGFTPNSLAILAGTRPNPPLLVHIHAALMASWLLLLVAQAILIGSRKFHLHRRLGVASLWLVPAMWLAMVGLVFMTFDIEAHPYSIGLVQLRRLVLFPAFWLFAILARNSDPDAHKLLQFWATLVLLDAAILRMQWLPDFGTTNTVAVASVYLILLSSPLIIYDYLANQRIHKANVIALLLVAGTSIGASAIW